MFVKIIVLIFFCFHFVMYGQDPYPNDQQHRKLIHKRWTQYTDRLDEQKAKPIGLQKNLLCSLQNRYARVYNVGLLSKIKTSSGVLELIPKKYQHKSHTGAFILQKEIFFTP